MSVFASVCMQDKTEGRRNMEHTRTYVIHFYGNLHQLLLIHDSVEKFPLLSAHFLLEHPGDAGVYIPTELATCQNTFTDQRSSSPGIRS